MSITARWINFKWVLVEGAVADFSLLLALCNAVLVAAMDMTGQCTSFDPVLAEGAFADTSRMLALNQTLLATLA